MQNNNDKSSYLSLVIITALLFSPTLSDAAIFKCINKKGDVYYNDKPCPVDNKETKLKNIKDPKNGYIPKPALKQKKKTLTTTGIVVGKNTSNEVDSKDKAEKRANEELQADNMGNKKQNSKQVDSAQSSSISSASLTIGNNTKVPTAQKELKKALKKALNNDATNRVEIDKYLSQMVH